jgi:hypothetical protein
VFKVWSKVSAVTHIPDTSTKLPQFSKIFVTNMPSRTDRHDATSLAAAVSNLKLDFIEGVGGDSIPERHSHREEVRIASNNLRVSKEVGDHT